MTTCEDVINFALQITKVYSSGEEADATDAALGLAALQSMYDQMVVEAVFGRLDDVYETANYEAGEQERVTAPNGVAVTFPTLVMDDDTGIDRPPRDLACIETIINGVRVVKIWDRTGWVELTNLALSDAAPLAGRGAIALAAHFAVSGAFATVFGSLADIGPNIIWLADQFKWSLVSKMGTTQAKRQAAYY